MGNTWGAPSVQTRAASSDAASSAPPTPPTPSASASQRAFDAAASNATRALVELLRGAKAEDLTRDYFRDTIAPIMQQIDFAKDLGLSPPSPALREVGAMNIVETDAFSLCFFFIPPGKALPLHDHPNMEIAQKVVCGKVGVRAFDWVEPRGQYVAEVEEGLAHQVCDRVYTSDSEVARIHPESGGVVHEIYCAGDEVCGFVDCISPPYEPFVRDCTFFGVSQQLTPENVREVVPPSPALERSLADGGHGLFESGKGTPYLLSPRRGYDGVPMMSFRKPQIEWL